MTKKKDKKSKPKKAGMKMDPYARMINDPCNATLKPGLYGSNYGLLARFHNRFTINQITSGWNTSTSGWVIWFPSYHNSLNASTTSNAPVNLVAFGGGGQPTIADFGKAGISTTAGSFNDPAASFVASDTCMDARTLSACMKITYTNTTSGAKGLVFPLTNIPIEAILFGGTGDLPPTVSQLAQYSTVMARAVDSFEVKWRPSMEATFRAEDEGCINPSSTSTGNTTLSSYVRHSGVFGIGFAFDNITAISDYVIDCYKNIEWRPEPNIGMPQQQPTGTENPGYITRAVQFLDRANPDWQMQMASSATQLVTSALSRMVLSGDSGPQRYGVRNRRIEL